MNMCVLLEKFNVLYENTIWAIGFSNAKYNNQAVAQTIFFFITMSGITVDSERKG